MFSIMVQESGAHKPPLSGCQPYLHGDHKPSHPDNRCCLNKAGCRYHCRPSRVLCKALKHMRPVRKCSLILPLRLRTENKSLFHPCPGLNSVRADMQNHRGSPCRLRIQEYIAGLFLYPGKVHCDREICPENSHLRIPRRRERIHLLHQAALSSQIQFCRA